MSLLRKLFSDKPAPAAASETSTQFQDSDADGPHSLSSSGTAPRRELVHVVLRDTMRRHGIPSDWIDCRVLPVGSRSKAAGMHVTFIVRGGHDRMLAFVPAFQTSFWGAMQDFEPRVRDWLLSLSWQFEGIGSPGATMPDPASRAAVPGSADDDLQQDLKALFAIRDAALRTEAEAMPDFQPTQPTP